MDTLTLYLQQFSDINRARPNTKSYEIKDIFADFHLLKYLVNNDIYHLTLVSNHCNLHNRNNAKFFRNN